MRALIAITAILFSTLVADISSAEVNKKWLTEAKVAELAGVNFENLNAVCSGKFVSPAKTLLKSALSGHIPSGDWRRFNSSEGSCSLIGGSLSTAQVKAATKLKKNISLVALDGSQIAVFRQYDIFGGFYRFRYYTTNNRCGKVALKAFQRTASRAGCVVFSNGCACTSNILGRTLNGSL